MGEGPLFLRSLRHCLLSFYFAIYISTQLYSSGKWYRWGFIKIYMRERPRFFCTLREQKTGLFRQKKLYYAVKCLEFDYFLSNEFSTSQRKIYDVNCYTDTSLNDKLVWDTFVALIVLPFGETKKFAAFWRFIVCNQILWIFLLSNITVLFQFILHYAVFF